MEQRGHSYEHYQQSKHVYAQNLESQEVWDFSKEDFVNRLIQNQIDGKMIEFESESQVSNMIPVLERTNSGDSSSHNQTSEIETRNVTRRDMDNFNEEKDIDSISRFNKKVQNINREYTAMLASTLESQRAFYEKSLIIMEKEMDESVEAKKN
jgi:BRCA1-associated protein